MGIIACLTGPYPRRVLRYLVGTFANQAPQKICLRPPDDEQQIQADRQPPNQEMSFASLANKNGMSPPPTVVVQPR